MAQKPLLPAALASVPFGFVLVRVRVRFVNLEIRGCIHNRLGLSTFQSPFETGPEGPEFLPLCLLKHRLLCNSRFKDLSVYFIALLALPYGTP